MDLMSAPNIKLEVKDKYWTTQILSLHFLLMNRYSQHYCFYCSLLLALSIHASLIQGSAALSHTGDVIVLNQILNITMKFL